MTALNDGGPGDAYADLDAYTYWGWGLADATYLYAEVYVQDVEGLAFGDAGHTGWFAAGTLTVSFDYWLAYDISTEAHEHAFADSEAILTLGAERTSDLLSIEAFNGMLFDAETPWETLCLSKALDAGETIDFSAMVSAQADVSAVPVPATVWLLGSGLVGLFGIRKNIRP